jgi:hypothetical protein
MDEIKKPESFTKYIEKTKYRVFVPFVILNYPFRWLAYVLDKVALLKVLEYIGLLGIIVTIAFYFAERGDRLKEKHYQAWQVINSAQGKPGSGGRIDALKDLAKDMVSLAHIDLSNADLSFIVLESADLIGANFSRATIIKGNISKSAFAQANFSNAIILMSNMPRSIFFQANFSEAFLNETNFSGSNFVNANLSGTFLLGSNFSGADLANADLSYANLSQSNLLNIKNWHKIKSIEYANLYGLKDAPEGFIEWAKENGAVVIENTEDWEEFVKVKIKDRNQK